MMSEPGEIDAIEVQASADLIARELSLPPIKRIRPRNQSCYYGARETFFNYAKLSDKRWDFRWRWQHGWIPDFMMVDPLVITATSAGWESDLPWLVATKSQEKFLKDHGFREVRAVGLPLVYSVASKVRRIPNSLLVMPGHSSSWSLGASAPCNEYAEKIAGLKNRFKKIVVCLSESCFQNGHWIAKFWKHGIPCVVGASISDRNSLERTARLLQSFETVTSNDFGSHLSYAAALGAKVSLFGDFPRWDAESCRKEPLYKAFPHLLETYFPLFSPENLKNKLEFLLADPTKAKQHFDWGRGEIGWDNRVTPQEARCFFERCGKSGSRPRYFARMAKETAWKGIRSLPPPLEARVSSMVSRAYREECDDRRRFETLRTLPRFVPGKIRLDGRDWCYADAAAFYNRYRAVYRRKCFAIRLNRKAPRFVDAGAHVGMVSRFWKEGFPDARIIAIEADGNLMPMIQNNLQGMEGEPVQVLNAAVWKNSLGVGFKVQGMGAGFVADGDKHSSGTKQVPSITLEELVDGRTVDFLKMDIEGAESEVLRAGHEALRWVDRIFLEYHSRPDQHQELSEIFGILERAGFRLWVNTEFAPERPFVQSGLSHGMDLQLNISGIKEELL